MITVTWNKETVYVWRGQTLVWYKRTNGWYGGDVAEEIRKLVQK